MHSIMSFSVVPPHPRFQAQKSLLVVVVTSSLILVNAAAAEETTSGSATLDTVVVEASKREESLSTMSQTVEVAGREELAQQQVQSVLDLNRVFPDLYLSYSASTLFPIMTLRGVTSAQDYYNPALTVYVDGVPQLPMMALQSLADVQQVELLKGPQGTLYGKSASGGVLNIVTRQPDATPYLHLHGGVASRDSYDVQGQAAGQLANGLFGSVALLKNEHNGDIGSDLVDGSDDLGGTATDAGRIQLRLAPDGADYQLNVSAARDCTSSDQEAYTLFDDIDDREAAISSDLPEAYRDFDQERCGNQYALNSQYDIGIWRLSAIASQQSLNVRRNWAIGTYYTSQPEEWDQTTLELKIATRNDGSERSWDMVAGVYQQSVDQSRSYIFDMVAPGYYAYYNIDSDNTSSSVAAYADVTLHLNSKLDVSVGGRFSHDSADTDFAGSVAGSDFSGDDDTSENTWLGRLSAGYQFTPAFRGYVNIAQGYKPVGYNLAPSSVADGVGYGRETSISYEAGGRYQSGTLNAHAALYRVNTRDVQMYGDNDMGSQTLTNVGDMHASGLELSADWLALTQLTLSAAGNVTQSEFDHYEDSNSCTDCSGNDVPLVPDYQFTLAATGHFYPAGQQLEPALSVSRTGRQYFDSGNSMEQPAYTLVNANIAWQALPGLALSLYGHNLTDETVRTYAFTFGGTAYAQINEGRTLGLSVDYVY